MSSRLPHKAVISGLIAALALTGCQPRDNPDPVVSRQTKWYVVSGINPPKHFYVDLREEGTNYVFKRQYVSKHCNAARDLKVGSRWEFVEVVRRGKNSLYSSLEGVKYEFCVRIRANRTRL